jgi:acyl carrier protein
MLKDELKALLAETLDIPSERLMEDTSFSRDLGIDSITVLKLVCALENKYSIEIDSDQLDLLDNLATSYRYINSLINEQK